MPPCRESAAQIEHLEGMFDVQAGGGLIEQNKFRLYRQTARN